MSGNEIDNKDIKKEPVEIDNYRFALEQANHWVESADSKTGIALSLISITFTLYAGFLLNKQVLTADIDKCNKIWLYILTFGSFVLFLVAIFLFVFTLFPRFKKPTTKENPYYYAEVASYKNVSEFTNHFMKEMDQATLIKGILESTWANSKIAHKKMKRFRLGILFTGLYFVISIACIILALVTKFPA